MTSIAPNWQRGMGRVLEFAAAWKRRRLEMAFIFSCKGPVLKLLKVLVGYLVAGQLFTDVNSDVSTVNNAHVTKESGFGLSDCLRTCSIKREVVILWILRYFDVPILRISHKVRTVNRRQAAEE